MKDRAMQALYLMALDPVAETCADLDSYGFRKGRSCADAIEQCFNVLSRKGSAEWVLEGDIKACFDHIDHEWLMRHVLLTDKHILQSWLQSGYLYEDAFYETTEGFPQGGVISPTLANWALDGLDQLLAPWLGTAKGRTHLVHYVRYADDFIITCRTKELLEKEILPLVTAFFAERGLTLSPEKTVITHISEGFDFLGQTLRKFKGKLIIRPSKKSIKAILEKIRATIRRNKSCSAYHLIQELNPIIQGWCNYHRANCSKKIFGHIDTAIFSCLWQWAKRRHTNKNHHWIHDKYFGSRGQHNWRFFGGIRLAKGEPLTNKWLLLAARTKIVRHLKIQKAANPYDPAYANYFSDLKAKRQAKKWAGYDLGYGNIDDPDDWFTTVPGIVVPTTASRTARLGVR
jgi:RNA-directed DNA polymerase